MMEEQQSIIGAIKIKDGLFIGDEYAAQDLEFVVTNKVTHIINCAGQNIGNVWEQIGVMYLTFPWTQSDQQILFDEQDEILNEIVKFIDEAAEVGESTLVHSIKGQSRACCVLAAYFMKKYNWALLKTLEFLNSRRPELEIRSTFFQQLTNLSKKLQITGTGAMIQDWHEVSYGPNGFVHVDELIVRNTFLNSRNAPVADIFSDEQVQMQMMRKEKKDKLTWNDIHHNRELQFAVVPNPDTFNPIQHYRSSSLNKKTLKSCLKGSNKHVRVGSEGQMLQLNQQQQQIQKGGMARSMSGKQIGVFGPQLKSNKSAKSLVEDAAQVGNQHSYLQNTNLQKIEQQNSSNNNFYANNNQDNSNLMNHHQISDNNPQQNQIILQNHPKSQSLYQKQQQTPVQAYSISLSQQSSFHQQQQPQLSQQIKSIQQQLPISNQLLQPNQVGLNSHNFIQNNQSGLYSQQYQQMNNYQQYNNQTPQLQTLGTGTNNYLNNNINSFLNNNSTTNNNNVSLNLYNNDYKNSNINIPNPISSNPQQTKKQDDLTLKTLSSISTSSKNANTFQNALTLNSVNASGSKSINSSNITSPYNQKNITNTLSITLNDKRSNGVVSNSNSGGKNNKMMPPQSAAMQEKKQNLISKILEQQPQQSFSTINTSSSIIRSNSLRGFENEKESGSQKQINISSKNTTQGVSKTNPTNQSINTSSNTSILQKNNTSFGSQLGNDSQSTIATAHINLNQPLSSQLQSGFRSNSLPKNLEDERSPSSKLQYQLQANNRHSSVSTKEKQESLLQKQKNQFSYLNNEMRNSQIQQNGTDKSRLQQNYIRSSSASNEQASSNEISNSKPQQSIQLGSQTQQQKQTLSSLMGVKSPVNDSSLKPGYIKNERPVKLSQDCYKQPLKPREQNSLTSTTNNTNSSVNTSLSKSFQQSTLSKYSANSNLQSQQSSTSDSNRYSNNNFTQFSNSNFTSSLNNNLDLKGTPSASSITQSIQNKMQINSIPTSINSDSSRANDNRYNNIPSSSTNKSPINGGPSQKTSLMSKPPQQKPPQSMDKTFKENYNIQPYTVYQPMQNNFMESQKLKDNITTSTSQLVKQNTTKVTPSYRSYSPDIQSLQNKLEKQKQMGTSKNRIRSNSPGQALSYNANDIKSSWSKYFW